MKEVFEAALSLPPEHREELADQLLGSLASTPDPEIEHGWIAELNARVKALDEGRVKTVPSDEVMARAYARLRGG